MSSHKYLLVVDGYNVIFKSPRYEDLIDKQPSHDLYCQDPCIQAREKLVADVAAYAAGKYEPVVVFDASGNVNPTRPKSRLAGVRLIFSDRGETADTVIERLVREARVEGKKVTLVTSDNAIKATVGNTIEKIGSDTFVANLKHEVVGLSMKDAPQSFTKMTMQDRLNADTLVKLKKLIGN